MATKRKPKSAQICGLCETNELDGVNLVGKYICTECQPKILEFINSTRIGRYRETKTTVHIEVITDKKTTKFRAEGSNFEEINEEVLAILEGIEAIHF